MQSLVKFILQKFIFSAFISLIFISVSIKAEARPEYAIKHGNINCIQCHAGPWGGGPRNVNGKLYGSNALPMGVWSGQDLFSLDLRALALYPDKPATRQNGVGLMTAIPWANIPITTSASRKTESRAVLGYGIGGLATGLRDAYIIFDNLPEEDKALVKNFVLGRFNAPFGLLTDEHRTIARQATATTVNDFEFGAAMSGDPTKSIHYDIALTNGFQSGGSLNGTDLPFAITFNMRHQPGNLPFFIGYSGSLHRKIQLAYRPYANSVWAALSIDRLSNGSISGSLIGEAVVARGWNNSARNSYISRFIPAADTAWQSAINDTQSISYYAMGTLDLTRKLSAVYKYDQYTPSKNYSGDAFVRHSIGVKWIFNSNMQGIIRREESWTKRGGITEDSSSSTRDGYLAVFHVWI